MGKRQLLSGTVQLSTQKIASLESTEDEACSVGPGCSPQHRVLALGAAGYNSLAMACRKSPFLHSKPAFEASHAPDALAGASDPLHLFLLHPLRRR